MALPLPASIPASELLTSEDCEPDRDRLEEEECVESDTQLRDNSTANSGSSRTPLASLCKKKIICQLRKFSVHDPSLSNKLTLTATEHCTGTPCFFITTKTTT